MRSSVVAAILLVGAPTACGGSVPPAGGAGALQRSARPVKPGTSRWRTIAAGVVLVVGATACGSGSQEASDAAASESTAEPPVPSASAEATRAGEAPAEPGGDGSDIDWATVDLTEIDWETIDGSSVDWVAVADNPTVADLDLETIGLMGSMMDRGSATLTIGDEVWEFETFSCVLGHENTRSETYSFTTNSFQSFDGVDTQMQVTIADPSGTGQVTGGETIHRISFDDVSDFENPSINWSMNTPNAVTIDGRTVTVEGLFNDSTTPEVAEEIPGTLEGTCSDDSRL